MFIALRRATLLIPSGPAHDPTRLHLFIVLCDPRSVEVGDPTPHVALVSLCSVLPDRYHDPSCILGPGDHPFITRHSYIYYADTWIKAVSNVENGVGRGEYTPREMLDEAVMARVYNGLMASRHAKPRVKGMCRTAAGS